VRGVISCILGRFMYPEWVVVRHYIKFLSLTPGEFHSGKMDEFFRVRHYIKLKVG